LGCAAVPQDERGIVVGLQKRSQRFGKTIDIGIVAGEDRFATVLPLNADAVDRANGSGFWRQPVEVIHHSDLIGDGDVNPHQLGVVFGQAREFRNGGNGIQSVAYAWDLLALDFRIVVFFGKGVRQRKANQSEFFHDQIKLWNVSPRSPIRVVSRAMISLVLMLPRLTLGPTKLMK